MIVKTTIEVCKVCVKATADGGLIDINKYKMEKKKINLAEIIYIISYQYIKVSPQNKYSSVWLQ